MTDPAALARHGFCGERFDALVSCMASRTGVPADAWAIDHRAHLHAPAAAREAGVTQVVLLSGQVARVQRGKPFLVFGDGRLTACKPISDDDLAAYLVDCLAGPHRALLRDCATALRRH